MNRLSFMITSSHQQQQRHMQFSAHREVAITSYSRLYDVWYPRLAKQGMQVRVRRLLVSLVADSRKRQLSDESRLLGLTTPLGSRPNVVVEDCLQVTVSQLSWIPSGLSIGLGKLGRYLAGDVLGEMNCQANCCQHAHFPDPFQV